MELQIWVIILSRFVPRSDTFHFVTLWFDTLLSIIEALSKKKTKKQSPTCRREAACKLNH